MEVQIWGPQIIWFHQEEVDGETNLETFSIQTKLEFMNHTDSPGANTEGANMLDDISASADDEAENYADAMDDFQINDLLKDEDPAALEPCSSSPTTATSVQDTEIMSKDEIEAEAESLKAVLQNTVQEVRNLAAKISNLETDLATYYKDSENLEMEVDNLLQSIGNDAVEVVEMEDSTGLPVEMEDSSSLPVAKAPLKEQLMERDAELASMTETFGRLELDLGKMNNIIEEKEKALSCKNEVPFNMHLEIVEMKKVIEETKLELSAQGDSINGMRLEMERVKQGQSGRETFHASNKTKLFRCPKCWRKFATASELSDHENVHGEYKLRQCMFCGLSFGAPLFLKIHLDNTHPRTYPCNGCMVNFKNQVDLRLHNLAMHDGQPEF